MNNSGFKYINNLDPTNLKILDLKSPEYVRYIREGGGNILNSPTTITYQAIAERLKVIAIIEHKEFVKGLMFLDLGIFDEDELEANYQRFIESYTATLINVNYFVS